MQTHFNLNNTAQLELIFILRLAERISGLTSLVRKKPWEVSLKLNTQAEMKKINFAYRGENYATDVLSFTSLELFRAKGVLGDLLICKGVLLRQAREHGHPPLSELRVLLVHGVLHLLGFDHERSPKAAREMAKYEQKLLRKLDEARGLIERAQSGTKKK